MKFKARRRENALERLEQQLEDGVKTAKGSSTKKVPLTEGDIKRINKEIAKLS